MPAGLSRREKCLCAQDFEAAVVEQKLDVGETEIDQMAGNIDAVPAFAEQQKLPARGVGDLDNQAAVGSQKLMRGVEITRRVVEMLEDVEHRHGGAASGSEGRSGKRRADRGDSGAAPGDVGGVERKIEAGHAHVAALGEHLKKQAAAAADVENQALFFRFGERPLDEMEMIAQNEAAIPLLQTIGGVGFGNEPVVGRIIIAQLQRRGLRMEADQPAVAALDDVKDFRGRR